MCATSKGIETTTASVNHDTAYLVTFVTFDTLSTEVSGMFTTRISAGSESSVSARICADDEL